MAHGSAQERGVLFGVFQKAVVAQLVEHFLGKEEVTGSIPVNGSRFLSSARNPWRRKNLIVVSRT